MLPSDDTVADENDPEGEENNTNELDDAHQYDHLKCPICAEEFQHGNQLHFHHSQFHAVSDPDIVTTLSLQCSQCKGFFARRQDWKQHICPAKQISTGRQIREYGAWVPGRHGPMISSPGLWHIATDGSGQTREVEGNRIKVAGWGAVVFRSPIESRYPDYVLHAPVIIEPWDPLWMGARQATNNTGELCAIGETMMWLLEEAPDDGDTPVLLRYDSIYAAQMAQGAWTPSSNNELVIKVQELVRRVRERRSIV